MHRKSADSYCYNCHHPIQIGDTFCGNCGQKHHKGKYTLGKLLTEFFETNFNLDGRIFRSVGGLLRPGFLSNQYFAGKHKRYNTPIQIFLVIAVIFFSIIGWSMDDDKANSGLALRERIEKKKSRQLQDSLLAEISIRNKDIKLQNFIDSLHSKKETVRDTVKSKTPSDTTDIGIVQSDFNINDVNLTIREDTIIWGDTQIPAIDIITKPAQEVINKYLPEKPWYQKVLFRQGLRLGMDQSKIMRFLISRLPLLILLVTPLFAILLKLLYLRRSFYFVEHFVFILHVNSAALFLGMISLIFSYYTKEEETIFLVAFLAWLLYFLFAMKYFYKQSWIKTIFKYILALMLGSIVAVFGTLLIFGIAFLIF